MLVDSKTTNKYNSYATTIAEKSAEIVENDERRNFYPYFRKIAFSNVIIDTL